MKKKNRAASTGISKCVFVFKSVQYFKSHFHFENFNHHTIFNHLQIFLSAVSDSKVKMARVSYSRNPGNANLKKIAFFQALSG